MKKVSIERVLPWIITLAVLICLIVYLISRNKWALFIVCLFTFFLILLANIKTVISVRKKNSAKTNK